MITINWGTRVISVPRADMTLLQASPEIRQLDVNTLWLALKDLEDDADGMASRDTHRRKEATVLSGVTYAPVVEIINGFTVLFEDGQYTVSCVGANHNLADVRVANQVSLIIGNSAGLSAPSFTADDRAVAAKALTVGKYIALK